MSRKVLVTGGAGFIGSNLVRELRSYERVHNAVRGVETVFHLDALGSVPRSVQDPLTSSPLPLRETMPPDPISPYGVAKLAAERYCVSFSRVDDLETVVLRYFNVFGPRQDPASQYAAVVPLFVTLIDAGKPVTIFGDGEQSRDFTFVANVVTATADAGTGGAKHANGQIMNVAAAAPASVNALADAIGVILGKNVEKRYAPERPGEIRDSWADISEAKRLIGFDPGVGLEEGLRQTAEHLLG